MAFPAGSGEGCLGTLPFQSCPGRCGRLDLVLSPSPSVALTMSLEAQVLTMSSQVFSAVSSPPLPARCRSDGLDRLRSRTPAWKGCGHACGETPRNSAETGKTPSSAETEPGAGRGAVPGEPGWRRPHAGPRSLLKPACEPACGGWVGVGIKRLQRLW